MKSPSAASQVSLPDRPAKLSAEDALEIFSLRPGRSAIDQTFLPATRFCRELCRRFNCGDRTIRDIWNRRSWVSTTRPLWNLSEIAADPKAREALDDEVKANVLPAKARSQGRPSGSSDTVARQSRRSELSPSIAHSPVSSQQAPSSASTSPQIECPSLSYDLDLGGESNVHEPVFFSPQAEMRYAALEADIFEHLSGSVFRDPFFFSPQEEMRYAALEADIFEHLSGSVFRDPFVRDFWTCRQQFSA